MRLAMSRSFRINRLFLCSRRKRAKQKRNEKRTNDSQLCHLTASGHSSILITYDLSTPLWVYVGFLAGLAEGVVTLWMHHRVIPASPYSWATSELSLLLGPCFSSVCLRQESPIFLRFCSCSTCCWECWRGIGDTRQRASQNSGRNGCSNYEWAQYGCADLWGGLYVLSRIENSIGVRTVRYANGSTSLPCQLDYARICRGLWRPAHNLLRLQ